MRGAMQYVDQSIIMSTTFFLSRIPNQQDCGMCKRTDSARKQTGIENALGLLGLADV
jgi:hypothetical protein